MSGSPSISFADANAPRPSVSPHSAQCKARREAAMQNALSAMPADRWLSTEEIADAANRSKQAMQDTLMVLLAAELVQRRRVALKNKVMKNLWRRL